MRVFIWLAGVFLAIIIIVLIILGFTRPKNDTVITDNKTLSSYADSDAVVTHTTSGRIVANEDHRKIIITVSRNSSTLQVIRGYQGEVLSSVSYANNTESFRSFLAALDKSGFTSSRTPNGSQDVAGQCSLGTRYIYTAQGVSGFTENLWSTSCSSREGTFNGSASNVRLLFQRQIPQYSNAVSGVRL